MSCALPYLRSRCLKLWFAHTSTPTGSPTRLRACHCAENGCRPMPFAHTHTRGETLDVTVALPDPPPADEERLRGFVADLLDMSLLLTEEWEDLDPTVQQSVYAATSQADALSKLVKLQLLTSVQAQMIEDGRARDLLLGHYRILGLLGRGGMGIVYRAEHLHLRREVAVKVITRDDSCRRAVRRFQAEARAAAKLQHPNLVACLDAGRHRSPDPTAPVRDYYVMEVVNGRDLEALVRDQGPLSAGRACDVFRQVAEAMAEAHRGGLIHRDLKPANVLITPDWQVKVLDFGLGLHPKLRMTDLGTVLGTIGYMAPEQARDPQTVDARADLFSLGATMYWALTGREPFPETGNLIADLNTRLNAPPPPIQRHRPELPDELCALVSQLLALDRDARPPGARVVAITLAGLSRSVAASTDTTKARPVEKPSVVLVDDEPAIRKLMRLYLGDEFVVTELEDGERLLATLRERPADLVVLDVNLPGVSGCELIGPIRSSASDGHGPMILLVSGVLPTESLGGLARDEADDFLAKPFTRAEFRSRIRALLGRKVNAAAQATVDTQVIGNAALIRPTPQLAPAPGRTDEPARMELLTGVFAQMLRETLSLDAGYGERLGRYVRAIATTCQDTGEYTRLKDQRFL